MKRLDRFSDEYFTVVILLAKAIVFCNLIALFFLYPENIYRVIVHLITLTLCFTFSLNYARDFKAKLSLANSEKSYKNTLEEGKHSITREIVTNIIFLTIFSLVSANHFMLNIWSLVVLGFNLTAWEVFSKNPFIEQSKLEKL